MKIYQTKTYNLEIKDIDKVKGVVTGYFSRFGNVDSDRDVIEKGAFAKTTKEWGPEGINRIKHLKNHNPNIQIGKIQELKEDNFGLFFVSQMSKTTAGKDALIEYQEKLVNEHSIGFKTIKDDKSGDGFNIIKEVQLWEGSAVTWGANMDTPLTSIKSIIDPETVVDRIDNLIKYIKIGEFSDEKLYNVELQLTQLQSLYSELKEPVPSTQQKEIDIASIFDKHIFNKYA